ncbi:hypothetical protein PV08_10759 [Exophiala spinifera]|uniref:Beta-glucuronidase C-terminal domain-containing protein n=1 Tax=Exophiala spinifera TaxID=91928 RepID=A0A0D2BJE5_9EURO|nr:uncharacterized protein PV08_10759 [Exophiala spinifera]KIW11459.1 hypothetical protein PV08_10759 [Exophiala spinifera]
MRPSASGTRAWCSSLLLLVAAQTTTSFSPWTRSTALGVTVPASAEGASYGQSSSFASFSFEPAFWVEFFGNASKPNTLTFELLSRIHERGGRPIIRPGGITMDSMIFDASAGDPERTTSPSGGVYRTTVGPSYFHSWSNFPQGTKFVSTLNFGNDSLDIARDMALASVMYQQEKIEYFELGNEPTNYPSTRWDNSTAAYVQQWKQWTGEIDTAVNHTLGANASRLGSDRWWASSATTDKSGLNVRPADIIPAGVDSADQVAEYSIHSYAFSTCDPGRAALATTQNILNHTELTTYADEEIYPSAKAALDSGKPWVVGEFNSISCSGQPNVTDTFAQALWTVDVELIYAVRNASSVHLHQGATLVFQSDNQVNSAGSDGSPGYSTYDILYPRDSRKRGKARALPSFVSQLFMAEAFHTSQNGAAGVRVKELKPPQGVDSARFAGYSFYVNGKLSKVALLNMKPLYANSTEDFSLDLNLGLSGQAWVKRMTAPSVDETRSQNVTWAGQSFPNGEAIGKLEIEEVGKGGSVSVRGSEAVLIFLDKNDVYGL